MALTVLVLSPHRGDAAFSLGLSIAAWLERGHEVVVLNCFTQSDFAPYSDAESLHTNDRVSFVSAVRRREDVAWAKRYGSQELKLQDLNMLDGPLRLASPMSEMQTHSIRPGDRAVERVRGAVAKMLRHAPPGELAVAAPLAAGNHIDHLVVREAVLQAMQESQVALAFYEDLPAADEAQRLQQAAAIAEAVSPELQPCLIGMAPSIAHKSSEEKRRMCDVYDSQVDSSTVQQFVHIVEQNGGRERVWGNAVWREDARLGCSVT